MAVEAMEIWRIGESILCRLAAKGAMPGPQALTLAVEVSILILISIEMLVLLGSKLSRTAAWYTRERCKRSISILATSFSQVSIFLPSSVRFYSFIYKIRDYKEDHYELGQVFTNAAFMALCLDCFSPVFSFLYSRSREQLSTPWSLVP